VNEKIDTFKENKHGNDVHVTIEGFSNQIKQKSAQVNL